MPLNQTKLQFIKICSYVLGSVVFALSVDFPANPLEKIGYQLVAHDEFSETKLNTQLWSPSYLASRTSPERSAAKYYFSNDCLVLFVNDKSLGYFKDGPSQMTASSLQTGDDNRLHKPKVHDHDIARVMNFAPKYGYFEIRAKLPKQAYAAFWLIGAREASNQSAEIDIFENIEGSQPPQLKFGLHAWDDKNIKENKDGKNLRLEPPFDPTEGFHTYGLDWSEKGCELYYDNQVITHSLQTPNYPCVILLTLQGTTKVTSQQEFVIDYFRGYQRKKNSSSFVPKKSKGTEENPPPFKMTKL